MRNLILLLSLMLIPTSVNAEWTKIIQTDEYNLYTDSTTKRKVGNIVSIWVMTDYKTPRKVGNTPEFLSMKVLEEYDCKNMTWRMGTSVAHSEHMGGGDIVDVRNDKTIWFDIVPDTASQFRFNNYCDKQ